MWTFSAKPITGPAAQVSTFYSVSVQICKIASLWRDICGVSLEFVNAKFHLDKREPGISDVQRPNKTTAWLQWSRTHSSLCYVLTQRRTTTRTATFKIRLTRLQQRPTTEWRDLSYASRSLTEWAGPVITTGPEMKEAEPALPTHTASEFCDWMAL